MGKCSCTEIREVEVLTETINLIVLFCSRIREFCHQIVHVLRLSIKVQENICGPILSVERRLSKIWFVSENQFSRGKIMESLGLLKAGFGSRI